MHLKVKDLKKTYSGKNGRQVLNGINFEVENHDFLTILGPSGCGKSTLLRCVGGLEEFEGQILIDGEEIETSGMDRIMVFQDFNQLFPWRTVRKNVEFALKCRKDRIPRAEFAREAEKYLELVGLAGYENYYPHELSGGMKQRAAIARALSMRPKIILMDEPFASLDAMTRRKLQGELLGIVKRESVGVLFVTHNIQEALTLGDQVLLMSNQGKIKLNIKNKLEKPVTPSTKGYGDMWNLLEKGLEE